MAVDRNELILQFKYQAQKANRDIDATNKKIGGLRVSTSGLRRSIGSLRNNLLLASFAFAGVTASIGRVIGISARFEAVKTRLVGLTGSVQNAEKAFDRFNQVAATTPFSLEDVVNAGAQLKAFGADANALIKPITDLAAFMGTTATEAANSFGRAFAGGAGAADILRERGILNIIKTSQGLTDLSKTTLPQFRQALISTLQDPIVGIVGSTDRLSETMVGTTSNMQDAFTRLGGAIGDKLLPITKSLAKEMTRAANATTLLIKGEEEATLDEQLLETAGRLDALKKVNNDTVISVEELFEIVGDLTVKEHELNSSMEESIRLTTERRDALLERVFAETELSNIIKDIKRDTHELNELDTVQIEKIKELSNSYEFLDSSQKATMKGVEMLSSNMADAILNAQSMKDAFVSSIKAMAAEVMAQATKFALLNFFTGGAFGAGRSFLDFAFAHTGGLITNKGVQNFHEGGMVGGMSNNVPIVAQAGEFVMQRSAVQSIGLNNLASMNETGQASNVINVSINGGIVDEGYVRNTLLPALSTEGVSIA
jgi:hypothetical protein